jgi:hypothetical protein
MKRLIHGVGINDSAYQTNPSINSKKEICLYYSRWKGMLQRCYSEEYISRNPTYKNCFVCDEWLSFMAFRCWMQKQDWNNKYLDKDIIKPGNKIYSPANCSFVDIYTNNLIITKLSSRGKYPIGVVLCKDTRNFSSNISIKSTDIHLGEYKTIKDAHKAYCAAKYDYIMEAIPRQTDNRVINGLKLHAIRYLNGEVK